MRPADFDYVRVVDLGHALEILAKEGAAAKVLAGGQSLIPMLTMRLVRPRILVDIGRLAQLRYAVVDSHAVRIGATVTHAQVEYDPIASEARHVLPVLGATAGLIAHLPIRTRGTLCGSIAHADPASEWCLLISLLDATVMASSHAGSRTIPAAAFFRGFLANDLREDEILTEVSLPANYPTGVRILEVTRRHGDFPIVSAGVALNLQEGRCADVRIALGGVADVPLRLRQLESELNGREYSDVVLDEAAQTATDLVDTSSDIHGSAEYRRNLIRVLVRRAMKDAARAAKGSQE